MKSTPSLQLIRLRFTSPLHLAKGKPSSYDAGFDVLHSDTLKAALFAMAVQIYGDEVTEGQTDDSNPFLDAFRISSGFPYCKFPDGREELFFPLPIGTKIKFADLGKPSDDDSAKQDKDSSAKKSDKRTKRIRFISRAIFEELLVGITPEIGTSWLSDDGEYASKSFAKLAENERFVSKALVEQRVTVPRGPKEGEDAKDAGDAKPYFLERLYFREDAGLFFLLDCPDKAVREKVLQSLKSLGENGVGLDRNTGNGHFEIEDSQPFDFQSPAQTDKVISLSLFCPTSETVSADGFLDKSQYELTKRGGWITQSNQEIDLSLRKKSVYMFAEGSLFPNVGLQGKLVNLKPEAAGKEAHPIWRDGRPILLPFQSAAAV